MTVDVNKLFEEIGSLSQVETIALGGSRATGRNDEKSDYDVYASGRFGANKVCEGDSL